MIWRSVKLPLITVRMKYIGGVVGCEVYAQCDSVGYDIFDGDYAMLLSAMFFDRRKRSEPV